MRRSRVASGILSIKSSEGPRRSCGTGCRLCRASAWGPGAVERLRGIRASEVLPCRAAPRKRYACRTGRSRSRSGACGRRSPGPHLVEILRAVLPVEAVIPEPIQAERPGYVLRRAADLEAELLASASDSFDRAGTPGSAPSRVLVAVVRCVGGHRFVQGSRGGRAPVKSASASTGDSAPERADLVLEHVPHLVEVVPELVECSSVASSGSDRGPKEIRIDLLALRVVSLQMASACRGTPVDRRSPHRRPRRPAPCCGPRQRDHECEQSPFPTIDGDCTPLEDGGVPCAAGRARRELAVPVLAIQLKRADIPPEGRLARGLARARGVDVGSAHWEHPNRVRSGRKQR